MRHKKYLGLFFIIALYLFFNASFYMHSLTKKIEIVKEENKVNRKQFAMYIKDGNDESYQEYTGSDLFPNLTKYTLNLNESYCVDYNDNLVSNSLYFTNGKVTITSNKTIYCYLYFDENLFDIETDILVQSGGGYKSVSETPTTDGNYNYSVRYDCTNNDAITNFGYNYHTHKYKIISLKKNKCNIYFEEMIPYIEVYLYINNYEVEEIPDDGTYVLNETSSSCTNSSAIITYDDTMKKIKVKSNMQTVCNVYLEGE